MKLETGTMDQVKRTADNNIGVKIVGIFKFFQSNSTRWRWDMKSNVFKNLNY